MNTYEITTTHGAFEVTGDRFETISDDLTGAEHCGYLVTDGGKLVAHIAPDAFVFCQVIDTK